MGHYIFFKEISSNLTINFKGVMLVLRAGRGTFFFLGGGVCSLKEPIFLGVGVVVAKCG